MKRLTPLLIVAFIVAFVGSAGAAGILVYKNEFKDRQDFKQMRKFEGKKGCGKSWKGKKTLGFSVKGKRRVCSLRTPVEGDEDRADLTIQAVAKVLGKTDRKVRRSIYVGLAVRANERSNYELRIFPKGGEWELIKSGQVVESGKEKAIEPINKKNTLRLDARGDKVLARVNGKELARFTDREPGEVTGRKTAVAFGNASNAKGEGLGLFDSIRVLVPVPK